MSVDCAHLGQIVVLNPAHSQYKCFSGDDVTQCDFKYLPFPQAMNLFWGYEVGRQLVPKSFYASVYHCLRLSAHQQKNILQGLHVSICSERSGQRRVFKLCTKKRVQRFEKQLRERERPSKPPSLKAFQ
jgi:hypothetical protein